MIRAKLRNFPTIRSVGVSLAELPPHKQPAQLHTADKVVHAALHAVHARQLRPIPIFAKLTSAPSYSNTYAIKNRVKALLASWCSTAELKRGVEELSSGWIQNRAPKPLCSGAVSFLKALALLIAAFSKRKA
jgi:hypothetical protein